MKLIFKEMELLSPNSKKSSPPKMFKFQEMEFSSPKIA